MINKSLNFPIMLISNKYIAGNIRNEDDLCQASESKFDAGCFNKCTILDSSGEKYNIISSTKKIFMN